MSVKDSCTTTVSAQATPSAPQRPLINFKSTGKDAANGAFLSLSVINSRAVSMVAANWVVMAELALLLARRLQPTAAGAEEEAGRDGTRLITTPAQAVRAARVIAKSSGGNNLWLNRLI